MKRKYRLESFTFYETDSIAAHLSQMAEEGWALSSVGRYFWKYTAIAPEKRTYGITFFPDVSAFDTEPSEAQEDFIAYCEEAGWNYVTQWQQMQIFYTTKEHPIPLETDETLRLETTHRAMRKNYLPAMAALFVILLIQLFQCVSNLQKNLPRYLTDFTQWFLLLLFFVLGIYALADCLAYLRWRKKSLAAVEAGGCCLPVGKGMRIVKKLYFWLVIFLFWGVFLSMSAQGFDKVFMWVLLMFLVFSVLVSLTSYLMRKKKASRNVHRGVLIALACILPVITTAVSFQYLMNEKESTEGEETYTATLSDGTTYTTILEKDTLPLTTADLTEVPEDAIYSTSCEKESSFLAKRIDCDQSTPGGSPEAPELSYEVLEVSYDFLIEPCIRSYQKPFLPKYADSESWEPISISGTDRAWQFHGGDGARPYYLAQKGNRLVYIHFYWQAQQDQLEKAMNILFAQTL